MPRADGEASISSAPRSMAGVPPESVRDALANLYDPGHLQTHPLAALVAPSPGAPSAGRALRQALLDAIDALRPERGGTPNARATRRHEILRLRYVEGQPVDEILGRLTIGRSEYYREHRQAVEALASLLGERLGRPEAPTGERPPAPAPQPTGPLPVYLTSFVGREAEGAKLAELLAGVRLLTLTGSGGCGKTRLAVQVATDLAGAYPAGVWFVDLASLADPALVPGAVLAALGLREVPGRVPVAAVAAHLRGRAGLLVLDSCEHLVDACARLAGALLGACPGLRALATSREPLGVAGETRWRVPPLATPAPSRPLTAERLAAYPSVRLFADRAAAVEPAFALTAANADAVARVCHRLDGIPLAIELAAARIRVLTLEQIAARLDELVPGAFWAGRGPGEQPAPAGRLHLLSAGSRTAPARQQTLRATLDWSHDLLAAPERVLFRRLAVFAGGFTLEAAEAVGAGEEIGAGAVLDLLTGLVDKSLAVADRRGGEARYGLLETVRAYALERLAESGEAAAARARHAAHYRELAERTRPELEARDGAPALARLDLELDNLRAALAWSSDAGDAETGLRLLTGSAGHWYRRGRVVEEQGWLERFLGMPDVDALPPRVLAEALQHCATCHAALPGAGVRLRDRAGQTLEAARATGDPKLLAGALMLMGLLRALRGHAEEARRDLTEAQAIFRELGEAVLAEQARGIAGQAALAEGDIGRARALLGDWVAASRRLGAAETLAGALEWLGNVALVDGDAAAAAPLFEESLDVHRGLEDRWGEAHGLLGLGLCAVARGDAAGARRPLRDSLQQMSEIHDAVWLALGLEGLAGVAALEGDARRALVLAGAAEASREAVGRALWPIFARQVAEWLAPARAALASGQAEAAWNEGLAMSFDQAVGYALEDGPDR